MRVPFPIIFSPKPSQTSQSIVDDATTTRSRNSTTITKLEEEFGPWEPPSSGLLSKFQMQKHKKPTTQGSVPCPSPSFYEEPWETLWDSDCEVDDVNLSQSPVGAPGFSPGSFPDYHVGGEQNSELDQGVATPTTATAWSSDEELTPLFSSNFPRIPHPDALRSEGHPDGELLGISAATPISPDTL